jgi:4-hydroxy-3-polyprenylbenzoate decarboxylase
MNLVLAMTGASGARAAEILIQKSPWPVTLIASRWGKHVSGHEGSSYESLKKQAAVVYENEDLAAPISSGSVPTVGMVVLPCSTDTLGAIASGLSHTLITRAAHCHLKESRKLILCLREAPLTTIDLRNASDVAQAGGTIMPLSPPFYMFGDKPSSQITLDDLLDVYVDRVLGLMGHAPQRTWESVK